MTKLSDYIKSLIFLTFPIIVGQLGQMLIGAGDVWIASLYSTQTVASIGVANGLINPIFLFGIGLMMGVSPALAIARGEGQDEKKTLKSLLVYSLITGLSLTFITKVLVGFVPYLGLETSLIPSIINYIDIVAWSFPFAIIFQSVKEFLQSFEEVVIPNIISMGSVIVNLAVNYILVFGIGNFEGIGEIGLAYASLLIRIFQFVLILGFVLWKFELNPVDWILIKKTFRFSLPIAIMFFFEVLAFCMVAILSGKLGVLEAASNNIILTLASISFMFPLSLGSAISVKTGHAYGAKNHQDLIGYTKASMVLTFIFVLCSSTCFLLLPEFLMQIMSNDSAVITLGVSLLYIVAIFQCVDSTQVVLSGVLRGIENTKFSSVLVFISYWVIGIPIGIYLAFFTDYSVKGLWIGLAISLAITALTISIYTFVELKKITRVSI